MAIVGSRTASFNRASFSRLLRPWRSPRRRKYGWRPAVASSSATAAFGSWTGSHVKARSSPPPARWGGPIVTRGATFVELTPRWALRLPLPDQERARRAAWHSPKPASACSRTCTGSAHASTLLSVQRVRRQRRSRPEDAHRVSVGADPPDFFNDRVRPSARSADTIRSMPRTSLSSRAGACAAAIPPTTAPMMLPAPIGTTKP